MGILHFWNVPEDSKSKNYYWKLFNLWGSDSSICNINCISPPASTIYEFLSVTGCWPCRLTPHILQSSHISGWGEKKKEKLVCATFSDTMVQTWKGIGKKSNIQRSHSQVSWRRKHSQPEEGWGPIQVTQPRHNLQVSFHQYINWSAFKVIQTRVQQHGKRCVYALRITPEQSLKTGGKTGGAIDYPSTNPSKKKKKSNQDFRLATTSLSHKHEHNDVV